MQCPTHRPVASVAGRGWLCSQAAPHPPAPGPAHQCRRERNALGRRQGWGSPLTAWSQALREARTGWAGGPQLGGGVRPPAGAAQGPLLGSNLPAPVPRVWSTGGWGYREGVFPPLRSQLYPPRPGHSRWLQPHRWVSKPQKAARNLRSERQEDSQVVSGRGSPHFLICLGGPRSQNPLAREPRLLVSRFGFRSGVRKAWPPRARQERGWLAVSVGGGGCA